jgi:hypothetical protein
VEGDLDYTIELGKLDNDLTSYEIIKSIVPDFDAIEHIKLSDPITANLLAKGTLRIDLKPKQTSLIKFGSNVEEYSNLLDKTITVVGTCEINEWNGEFPQIKIMDYFFESVSSWDF